MFQKMRPFLLLVVLSVWITSCQPGMLAAFAPSPTPEPTATSTPTNTPAPTDTPTPTPTDTPEPTATATATPNRTATAQAKLTATAQSALAEIEPELKKYDLSTDGGYLGWLHDPVDINLNTYLEERYDTDYPDTVVGDFVFYTEMTWNTTTGLAGCGFIIRSEEDFERGKQYRVFMIRLQGLPLWDIEYYNLGRFQKSVTGEILSTGALFTDQGSKNRITIVVQGNKIATYANGERMGVFTDSKLTEGRIAFFASQESGETTCHFENSWLWVLK